MCRQLALRGDGSWTLLEASGRFGVRVPTPLPPSAQEVLENLKDRWYQADNPPSDMLLTEDEFLSFLHPEHSRGMLKFMVKEIIRDLGEALTLGALGHPPAGSLGAPEVPVLLFLFRRPGRGQAAVPVRVHLPARGHRGEPAGPGHGRPLGQRPEARV